MEFADNNTHPLSWQERLNIAMDAAQGSQCANLLWHVIFFFLAYF